MLLVPTQVNAKLMKIPFTILIMTVGASEVFRHLGREEMLVVAKKVPRRAVFEECGHSLV